MSKNILVVDDDAKILQVIKIMLQHEGFTVTAISDSPEGLALAQGGGFDLVILDVMMPALDGYEFFDRLRQDERTQALPVLLLTAKGKYDIIRDRSRYFLYGLYGFMSKPFFGRELIQKVWDILSVAEAQRAEAEKAEAGGGTGATVTPPQPDGDAAGADDAPAGEPEAPYEDSEIDRAGAATKQIKFQPPAGGEESQ